MRCSRRENVNVQHWPGAIQQAREIVNTVPMYVQCSFSLYRSFSLAGKEATVLRKIIQQLLNNAAPTCSSADVPISFQTTFLPRMPCWVTYILGSLQFRPLYCQPCIVHYMWKPSLYYYYRYLSHAVQTKPIKRNNSSSSASETGEGKLWFRLDQWNQFFF